VSFAARREAGIERDQRLIPTEGGRQRGGEQRAAQAPASSGDVALAFVLPAIIVERSVLVCLPVPMGPCASRLILAAGDGEQRSDCELSSIEGV
jgi:hypothetical protein